MILVSDGVEFRAVVDGETVGTCGFKGPPKDGWLEIAYICFPEYRRRGFATRMVEELLQRTDGNRVFALTLPDHLASIKILLRFGFASAGETIDPKDGARVIRWERIDWSRLHHAYGRAADTPGHLRALLDGNADAFEHLWSAILHQGSAWTATASAARTIAAFLSLPLDAALLTRMISFLAAVAHVFPDCQHTLPELEKLASLDLEALLEAGKEDALYNQEAGDAMYARSVLDCFRAGPILMSAVLPHLEHPDAKVRVAACDAATTLAKSAPATDLERRLVRLAESAADSDQRSAFVLAMGELGLSPAAQLDDISPAVRLCAALAPPLAQHPGALRELLRALELHAGEIDGWFRQRPPQFEMHPRFYVVRRLVAEVRDFDRLAPAAIAVARVANKYTVDQDWGPFLAAAFPDGGGVITDSQRRYLSALVDNSELWDPRWGNAIRWFRAADLPYDRQACGRLIR